MNVTSKRIKKINLWALILAVLVFFYLFYRPHGESLLTNFAMSLLARNGTRTWGVVVEKESFQKRPIERDKKGNYRINLGSREKGYGILYYQYRSHNQKLHTGQDTVNEETFHKYDKNDPISIVYFKNAPFFNKLESNLGKFYSNTKIGVKKNLRSDASALLASLKENPNDLSTMEKLARHYLDAAEYAKCIEWYNSLIDRNSKNPNFHADLGYCYSMSGSLEEGIKAFLKATELEPHSARNFKNLGVAYQKRQDWENAVNAFEKSIALNPNDKDVVLQLAITLENLKQYEKGIRYLENYLTHDSHTVEVYYMLSRLAARLEDSVRTLIYLKKGLEIFPEDQNLNFKLGQFYLTQGNFELAEKQLQILSGLNSNLYEELRKSIEEKH